MSLTVTAGPAADSMADATLANVEALASGRSPIDVFLDHNPATKARFEAVGRSKRRPAMPSMESMRQPNHIAQATRRGGTGTRRATLTPAKSVAKKRPRFLDYPLTPTGVLTFMAGRAGVSKSTLALYRAALATRGLLEGDWKHMPVNVVVSGIEDSMSMQRMRLEAAGADLSRVSFLTMRDGDGPDGGVRIPDDLPQIEAAFIEHNVRLWIIDPITSAMDGDSNKRDDVRRALDPLAEMADRLGIAVIGILHFNKGGGYASDKISGSHAFRDVIRSLLLVARDDDNGDCVVTVDKSSYTTAQGESYSYALISQDVTDDDGQSFAVPKVTGFMPTSRSVDEVINRNITQDATDAPRAERGEVLEWLIDFLQDGPAPYREIATAASAEGYSKRQLTNARERSSNPWVVTVPDPDYQGRGQKRLWKLSDTDPKADN